MAGATVAGIAINQLVKHWDDLASALGQGAIRTEAEQMEELAKKTKKTADEMERLAKFEELRKHADAQKERPESEQKRSKAVDDAIAQGPVEDIDKGLDKHFGDRIRLMADTMDKDVKEGMIAGVGRFFGKNEFGGVSRELEDSKLALKQAEFRRAGMNSINAGSGDDLVKESQDRVAAAQAASDKLYAAAREKFRAEAAINPDRAKEIANAATNSPDDFGKNGAKVGQALTDAIEGVAPGEREKASKEFQKNIAEFWKDAKKAVSDKQKELDKQFRDDVAEAKRTQSFMGQPTKKLTPAQQEAARQYEQEVQKSVRDSGFDNPNIQAANLKKVEEADEKAKQSKAKKLTAEEEKAKRESEGRIRDAQKDFDLSGPRQDEKIKNSLMIREANGQSPVDARNALVDGLADGIKKAANTAGHDLSDSEARDAARERIKEAQNRLDEDVFDYMNDPQKMTKEQKQESRSEMVGLTDFYAKIQGSVSDKNYDELREANDTLKQIHEVLAQSQGGRIGATFG